MSNSALSPSFLARRGFTLPEILVVLVVVGVLGALLFPVFGQARESSRQGHCASNLANIYVATRQYREDFQGFPPTLEVLLPPGTGVVATSGDQEPLAGEAGGEIPVDPLSQLTGEPSVNNLTSTLDAIDVVPVGEKSLSYLKTTAEVVCPSDTVELNGFSSSYGNKIGSVWNFYGYDRLGFQTQTVPAAGLLIDPKQPYDARRNPAKWSLANRFAPPGTIITHCIFHRTATSQLKNPYALATPADNGAGAGASDIVLRLDGTAKRRDVSTFRDVEEKGRDNQWQTPTF